MKYIFLRLMIAVFLYTNMQFCSNSSSARTSQETLSPRSRSGSLVSNLRKAVTEIDFKKQVAEEAAAAAHKQNYEKGLLQKKINRQKRHSFHDGPLVKYI